MAMPDKIPFYEKFGCKANEAKRLKIIILSERKTEEGEGKYETGDSINGKSGLTAEDGGAWKQVEPKRHGAGGRGTGGGAGGTHGRAGQGRGQDGGIDREDQSDQQQHCLRRQEHNGTFGPQGLPEEQDPGHAGFFG